MLRQFYDSGSLKDLIHGKKGSDIAKQSYDAK
jgi:hypothetical protein